MERHPARFILAALFIVFLSLSESYIPYYIAERNKPFMSTFLGQVDYPVDQNMYFSFIRQAHHLLFNNRLTAIPNSRVFFNIEFLTVGKIMYAFNLSEGAAYQVWRFLGILALTFGFALLSLVALPTYSQRKFSLCVFIFSGGSGVVFLALSKWLEFLPYKYIINGGLLPFQQIISNPHFSLPHGLMLIGLGLFLLAEKRLHSLRLYIASGMVFFVDGFVRPYDLISLCLVIPVFIGIEAIHKFDLRIILLRAIPLVVLSPAMAYSIWIFKFNQTFKYWSLQGYNIGLQAPFPIHMLAYGIIGILAFWRISQYKSNPLSLSERFLCVWFMVVFCLSHIGELIPTLGFSPQVAIVLFAPLVLLAFSLRLPFREEYRPLFLSLVAFVVIVENLGQVAYYSQKFIQGSGALEFHKVHEFYANNDEITAYEWINKYARGRVILASPIVSGRICKYTDASAVIGHYSVTPHYEAILAQVHEALSPPQFTRNELRILQKIGANFLFIGPEEQYQRLIGFDPNTAAGLSKVFAKGSVEIYKVE